MLSTRKFYRTVVTFEILSEEPLGDCLTLADIDAATTDGHCSGKFLETKEEVCTSTTMAKLLLSQGSDPEFFEIDANGNETA